MAELLICRGCRNPYTSEKSCALCAGAKSNMLVEEDGENESLAKMAGSTLRLLKSDLRRLETRRAKSNDYDAALAREARQLAGAISKLLEASRKVIQDGVDAVEAMSFQERAALFMEWAIGLPPVYRRRLHADLSRHVPAVELPEAEASRVGLN